MTKKRVCHRIRTEWLERGAVLDARCLVVRALGSFACHPSLIVTWHPSALFTIALSSGSGLPEIGPADKVDDADDDDEDGANVEKELCGGVAVLVGGLAGHSQEEENQAGEAEEDGPKRDAGDVCGEGGHAGMLAEK
jgi:hypothetical protein